ncbi:hypothetical protein HER10_EVM0010752 [Colletotrichum scovillei]|uniref:uncharacterized protein n=1 Tax=Colletotrichum scovillei TaxID=1209932 RepID=UPI0015C3F93D|nr:uncharacterized protein HER10_EVM0010752 [Colletotrichum scovillei]KAF4781356.1 hypothetical protein HER10_EVM0010752 [Colletotrichum scovillei]
MTPLEIIGLVSAIITFIDFAAENVTVAREIERTGSATFKDNADLERRVKLVEEHVTGLNTRTIGAPRNTNEAQLLDLVEEYKSLTVQLMTLLAGLKSTKKRHILSKMVKDFRKKDEKETLQKDLDDCRSRIHLQLTQLTRSELSRRLDEISAQGHINATDMQHLGKNIKELQFNIELWKHVPGLVESAHDILSRSKEAVESTAQRLILEKLYVGDMTRRFDEIERAHEKTFSWLLGSSTPPTSNFDSNDGSDSSHSDGSSHVSRGENESPNEGGQNSDQFEVPDSGPTSDDSSYEESDYQSHISLERTARELQAQQDLIDWLSHGGGIFHVSGKPGAGKSTLMKYLCQSTATESYLKDWAGEKTLILANFFFWKLGSTAQKSLDGLLRALSYSILEQAPALLETVFPKQWSKASQRRAFSIQSSEIESAFSHLLRQTTFFSSHKIAIFIDGLDEFDGDHDKMIKMLRNWSKSVPEDIKLCVSSREWEVFRQRLVNCPGIRLQDITSRDIEAYINSELADNEDFRSYSSEDTRVEHLIYKIKDKAEGVFLWVKITLRGLKWGLLSGERVENLEARLEALPAGVEELFASILTSIRTGNHTNKLDRMRATRMLLLAAEQAHPGYIALPLLLTELAFLDDYEKDPNFAFGFPIANDADGSWISRQDKARRSVYQCCMGLLEVKLSADDTRPRLMRGVCGWKHGQLKKITSQEESKYNISESLLNEIQSSLQNDTAQTHQEARFEIIDKGSDSWPISLDGGFYQLGRRSKRDSYHNMLLDFCLHEFSHLLFQPTFDRKVSQSYKIRAGEYISKCFEAGADPNGPSLLTTRSGSGLTCWQTWIIASIDNRALSNSWGTYIWLFLLHGADPNVWVHFEDDSIFLWWHGASKWYKTGDNDFLTGIHTYLLGETNLSASETDLIGDWPSIMPDMKHASTYAESGTEGFDMFLGDFLHIWLQEDDTELQELFYRKLGSSPKSRPPPFQVEDVLH